MTGHLCLSWNNHGLAFNKMLQEIHLKNVYSDGVLLCQQKIYPVHSFVLSACSEYFEEVFQLSNKFNNKQPFIVIKDTPTEVMDALLSYMYKGIVNVPQEMLPKLIRAAEFFKIKGLAVSDHELYSNTVQKRSGEPNNCDQSSPKKSRNEVGGNTNTATVTSKISLNNIEDKPLTFKSKKDLSPITDTSVISKNIHEKDIFANKNLTTSTPTTASNQDDAMINLKDIEGIFLVNDNGYNLDFETDPENSLGKISGIESLSNIKQEYGMDNDDNLLNDDSAYDIPQPDLDLTFHSNDDSPGKKTDPFRDENSDEYLDVNYATKMKAIAETYMQDLTFNVGQECPVPECKAKHKNEAETRVHLRSVHVGEKLVKCSLCSYKANQKGSVIIHIRGVHMNEKPFKCPFCEYRAKQRSNIAPHVKAVHLNDKPYKCPACPFAAVQKNNLFVHMTNIHCKKKTKK